MPAVRIGACDLRPYWRAAVLPAADYRLFPYPAPDGVHTSLRVIPPSSSGRWCELIEITGMWGWATVPVEAEMACKVTVAIWLRALSDHLTG